MKSRRWYVDGLWEKWDLKDGGRAPSDPLNVGYVRYCDAKLVSIWI
jgi:hypothetical protein